MNAIPICQTVYNQPNAYSGVGSINELNATNQGCLSTGENNSTWYILTTSTAGTLVFTLTPNVTSDYDIAVWDLTDKSCADIGAGLLPIRCNYASLANSTPGGLTGLSTAILQPSIGAGGGSFSSAINALPGQTFVILVNNASGNAAGYNMNFSLSTCQIADNSFATIKSITLPGGCNAPNTLTALLSENVKCSSFVANGSDFSLTPANATITSASAAACIAGGGFANKFVINFSNPLPAGNYTLSIKNGTDANTLIDNCNNSTPVGTSLAFTVLPALKVNVATVFGCAGVPSGSITASSVGGTPPFQYKLNAGVWGANNVFTGLAAGSYTIYLRDVNNCQDDTIVNLVPTSPVVINSISLQNPNCYGANNGTATVNASGGAPPLNYAANLQPFQASNILTNLGPGNYIVTAKDANGCTATSVIFLSSPGQILVNTLTLTNPTCGASNGAINITAYGGTPPLNYALNAGAYQISGNFTGLAAGNYTVHIKDGNNCIKDTVVNLTPIGGVTINSLSVVQPACVGNLGSITVNGGGGVGPYTYSINGVNFQAGNVFSPLVSGSYTVTIKDANGCTATSATVLNSPGHLYFANAVVVFPTCVTLGSITVTGNGGAPPYTYAINAGAYSPVNAFPNLAAGTYTLHVQDNSNCIHDTIITLNITQQPIISNVVKVNPTCSFPSAGSISVTATGGTLPYTFSLNAGPYVAGNVFNTLVAGTYTVTVKDANNCTSSSIVVLSSANTLNFIVFTHTNVGCGGAPLAVINAVAGNGNPAYQYSLNGGPFQPSGNYPGLGAGTYTVVARDASNCTVSSVTVITSSAIVAINSVIKTNSSCYSPGTGSITITGTVTAIPINYLLNFAIPNAGGVFNGLGPGTYTVSVYDANGCHKDSVVTITSPPPLYFTNVNIVNPPCFGGLGSISLLGAGGTPGYTYAIGAGVYGAISNWINLPMGPHTIHLKDANGCIKDTVIYLQQPPDIVVNSLVLLNASCNGNATGSINITALGGVSPYQYGLNAGPYGPSGNFTNLAAGTYTVKIMDANGCTKTTVVTLNNNGNFYVNSIVAVQPNCFGDANGSLSLSVTGGVAPYLYNINGGANGPINNFNGLASGFYTLHAQDNSGCFKDTVVYLAQPVQLGFAGIVLTPTICFGTNTGTATATGTGGVPSYQYKIDAGAYGAGNGFINLSPGNHTIMVKDAKGCEYDTVITITQPLPVNFANVTVVSPGCIGNTGIISVGGSGGVPPYTFAINGGAFVANGAFGNLLIGTYTLTVKDNNGCTHDTTIVLSNATVINITNLNFTPILCPGATNGFISVSAISPYPPLTYSLNGGVPQGVGLFSNLLPGAYILHIEDQLGCYVDSNITISVAPPIVINSISLVSPLCFNTNDGSITINASGGLGPKYYTVNALPYTLNNTISNLGIGTYTVHIKDSLNCVKDSVINLTGPPPIVVTNITMVQPYCSNATTGAITIAAAGGFAPYQFAINASLYSTNPTFSNLLPGIYTLHVMDINGCIIDTVVNLQAANYMNFTSVVIVNVSCKFGNDGSISLAAVGGFNPYSYFINAVPNGNSGYFPNLAIGSYTISVTDNIGCQDDTVLSVSEPLQPATASVALTSGNFCKGDSAGSVTGSASGGTPPYTYSIDGINFQNSSTFTNLLAGNYTLTIKDSKGCTDDTTFVISEPATSVLIQFISKKEISCADVNDAAITVSSVDGTPPLAYYLNGVLHNTDTFFNNLSPGEYIIEVRDSIGCVSTGKYDILPSEKKPYIIVDSVVGILCAGDKTGYLGWHAIDCYPPYRYIFNTVPFGATNFANNITDGAFLIQVLDTLGCYNDTIVYINPKNPIEIQIAATPASCGGRGDDGKATATVVGGVPPFVYAWTGIGTNTVDAYNLKFGKHWGYVKDNLGCVDSTEFEIIYEPCCNVILPNAFTPNGDNNNDVFRILKHGDISLQSFEVYNRFGAQVFRTKNLDEGWDGKLAGSDAEVGTYFFLVRYKCPLSDETQLLHGDVILLR
jgi:gliding motility-associated-like protein